MFGKKMYHKVINRIKFVLKKIKLNGFLFYGQQIYLYIFKDFYLNGERNYTN